MIMCLVIIGKIYIMIVVLIDLSSYNGLLKFRCWRVNYFIIIYVIFEDFVYDNEYDGV